MDGSGPTDSWRARLAAADSASDATAVWLEQQLSATAWQTLTANLQHADDLPDAFWQVCDEHLSTDERLTLDCLTCFPSGQILGDWLLDLVRQFKALPPLSGLAGGGAEVDLLDRLIAANLLRPSDEAGEHLSLGHNHYRWRLAAVESQPARNKTVSNAVLLYLRNRARPTAKNKAVAYRQRELPQLVSVIDHIGHDGAPMSALQIANGVAAAVRKHLGATVAEKMLTPLLNPPLLESDDEARITHVVGLESLSFALRDQKRFADSEAALDRAIAILRRLRGADSAGVGMLLHSKALVASDQLRFAEAESLMWQAVAMRRKFFSDDHSSFWAHHAVLAVILRRQSKFAEAAKQAERALEISQINNAGEDRIASDFGVLAALYRQAGMFEQALETIERSLSYSELTLRIDDPKMFVRRLTRAKTLLRLKRFDEARAAYEQMLEFDPPDDAKPHLRHSTALNDLAIACLALKDLPAALEHMQRAVRLREMIADANPEETLKAMRNLQLIQRRSGDTAGAADTERRIEPIKRLFREQIHQKVQAYRERQNALRKNTAIDQENENDSDFTG